MSPADDAPHAADSSDAPEKTAQEKLAEALARRKAGGGGGAATDAAGQKRAERAAAARSASKSRPAPRK